MVQKAFKKQFQYLEKNLKMLTEKPYLVNMCNAYLENNNYNLYQKENGYDPLDSFWREMGLYDMIKILYPQIEKVFEKGYKKQYRLFKPQLEANGFRYDPNVCKKYVEMRGEINLSDYKGSITRTTKEYVIKTIKNYFDYNQTLEELTENITKLNKEIFSPARAKLIAVQETHKAYEYANHKPVEDLHNVGLQVKKKWLTLGDLKVRDSHKNAEALGWVDFKYVYPEMGVEICPEGFNCRCTMIYEIR